jgi:hypothetical protein
LTVAEIHHVALTTLPVEIDGERVVLEAGDQVPPEIIGPWVSFAIDAGKVAVAPTLDAFSDEELLAEVTLRGLKLTQAKKSA